MILIFPFVQLLLSVRVALCDILLKHTLTLKAHLNSESNYVDEAVELAKTVLNANSRSCLLVLCPMLRSNVGQMATVNKKRKLEDKLFQHFVGHFREFQFSL